MEMRVIVGVVNVEMGVEMVMLKELELLVIFLLPNFLLFILFLINLNLLLQLLLFLSYNFSPIPSLSLLYLLVISPITSRYISYNFSL